MQTVKKAELAPINMRRDPDNAKTIILDRWPTREEKAAFAEAVHKIRLRK